MTRHILTFLFCSCTTFLTAQTDKVPCHNLAFIVNKTIEALNKRDTSTYFSLADYKILLRFLNDETKIDTNLRVWHVLARENKNVSKAVFADISRSNFLALIKSIEKELKTSDWTIELADNYNQAKELHSSATFHSLFLKVKIKGEKYSLTMVAIEYNDCYYLWELKQNLTSGW